MLNLKNSKVGHLVSKENRSITTYIYPTGNKQIQIYNTHTQVQKGFIRK